MRTDFAKKFADKAAYDEYLEWHPLSVAEHDLWSWAVTAVLCFQPMREHKGDDYADEISASLDKTREFGLENAKNWSNDEVIGWLNGLEKAGALKAFEAAELREFVAVRNRCEISPAAASAFVAAHPRIVLK